MLKKTTLSIIFVVIVFSTLVAKSILSKSSVNYPGWLKLKSCTLDNKYPGKLWGSSRSNEKNMKINAGKLLFLIDKHPKDPKRPFLMYQLARHLMGLNEYKAAEDILKNIQKLPGKTPYQWKYWLKTLPQLKREVSFMQMKCAAKLKKGNEVLKIVKQLKPGNGYENLRFAETYVLLGEYKKAVPYLEKSNGAGHPNKRFSNEFIRMYAATLARAIGENDLAVKIAGPILKKGSKAKKGANWRAVYSILKKITENIDNEKIDSEFLKKKFKEGRFSDACMGYVDLIIVNAYFDKKGFRKLYVGKKRENRPWSAVTIVPKRISEARSLGVDAITGATISSCAIIVAADSAAGKAFIKEK